MCSGYARQKLRASEEAAVGAASSVDQFEGNHLMAAQVRFSTSSFDDQPIHFHIFGDAHSQKPNIVDVSENKYVCNYTPNIVDVFDKIELRILQGNLDVRLGMGLTHRAASATLCSWSCPQWVLEPFDAASCKFQ